MGEQLIPFRSESADRIREERKRLFYLLYSPDLHPENSPGFSLAITTLGRIAGRRFSEEFRDRVTELIKPLAIPEEEEPNWQMLKEVVQSSHTEFDLEKASQLPERELYLLIKWLIRQRKAEEFISLIKHLFPREIPLNLLREFISLLAGVTIQDRERLFGDLLKSVSDKLSLAKHFIHAFGDVRPLLLPLPLFETLDEDLAHLLIGAGYWEYVQGYYSAHPEKLTPTITERLNELIEIQATEQIFEDTSPASHLKLVKKTLADTEDIETLADLLGKFYKTKFTFNADFALKLMIHGKMNVLEQYLHQFQGEGEKLVQFLFAAGKMRLIQQNHDFFSKVSIQNFPLSQLVQTGQPIIGWSLAGNYPHQRPQPTLPDESFSQNLLFECVKAGKINEVIVGRLSVLEPSIPLPMKIKEALALQMIEYGSLDVFLENMYRFEGK